MKYSVNKTNYGDFSVIEINKREGRGYSIPYSSKETLRKTQFSKERNSSDIVRVLSGDWQFRYYPSRKDIPDVLDTDSVPFDSIKVPEHVTGEQLKALNNFQITVIAEAIQADGFTGAADAWSHF